MIFTYGELQRDGWTPGQIRHALLTGELLRVCRGVYADARPVCLADRVRGELRTAPDAVASHHTAALLDGFGDPRAADLLHLKAPWESPIRPRPGLVIHRATRPTPWREHDGVRLTTAYQTVLDLARWCGFVEGVVYADAALHAQVCDRDELLRRASRLRYLPGARRARAVLGACRVGAQSPMETRTRLVLVGGGLPDPQLQHPVQTELGTLHVDIAWPGRRVCVEYDGREAHGADDPRSPSHGRDRRRWRALSAAGWNPYPITAADLRAPARLVAEIGRALA